MRNPLAGGSRERRFSPLPGLLAALLPVAILAADVPPHSLPAPEPEIPGPSPDFLEREALERAGALHPLLKAPKDATRSARPKVDDDFIVFGYAQFYGTTPITTYTDHYRWEGLTHVGSTFITFDESGDITNPTTWTERNSNLRAGGAAQAAGVKVIMVVLNSGFTVDVLNTVFASSTARTNLKNDIVSLLTADPYAHGVSFDFEPFSWNATATAGMNTFFADLRAALGPDYEISFYVDPTPSATQWNLPGFAASLDYILYSGYDFGTGSTPRAVTDHNSGVPQMGNFYLAGGFKPSQFVSVISTYGRIWDNTTSYGVTGGSTSTTAVGMTDGLLATTILGRVPQYVRGDEAAWYTYNDGVNHVVTWDSPESIEYKFRHALSFQGSTNYASGPRLRGVGYWSLMWTAETSSRDPLTGTDVSKTRLYPHPFQLAQEAFHRPGDTTFSVTGFEGLDFRWRDPNESPDTSGDTDSNTARSMVSAPAGTGRPVSTTNAMQLLYDFEGAGQNRCFLRYEPLASPLAPSKHDYHAVPAIFDSTTAVSCHVYSAAADANSQLRLIVLDGQGELEASDPFTLNTSGWRQVTFDLADASQVNAYNTSESLLKDGDGIIDTAGAGAKDIAFLGFVVESTGARVGTLVLDEVTYRHSNPGGLNFVINEFAYRAINGEFVEIYGMPGSTTPAGLQLRVLDSTDGSVIKTVSLGGRVVPAGGVFAVGDPAVSGVASSAGFSDTVDDLRGVPGSTRETTGLQLYDPNTGCVYDSVVYEAFGGLGDLIRMQTLGVTGEGYPWLGEVASGPYAAGRYPDGADSQFNNADFKAVPLSPGKPNASVLPTLPVTHDFSSSPASAFLTYAYAGAGAVPSGVGASPGGGNVYRVADTSGGNMAFFTAPLSAGSSGHRITGQVYIPAASEPAQAICIGFCGTHGSTFFEDTPDDSGYENGYWLVYQNTTGVDINNGLGSHSQTFRFVLASHDNMDGSITVPLASATPAQVGLTAGRWTTFLFEVDPAGGTLTAAINGTNVYQGAIPAGGPVSGSFQAGHREDHTGGTAANEGTWLDTLSIRGLGDETDIWVLR